MQRTRVITMLLFTLTASGAGADEGGAGWSQSYAAGYIDGNGAYAGGSEIMHLAAHKGKLYAANGYWEDSRWADRPYADRQSAQVLRLDSVDGRWEVDLDMGRSNPLGFRYMKGNILKSLTFSRDGTGKPLPEPRTLLLAAAGAYKDANGCVSAWTRADAAGKWHHDAVLSGSRAGGVRWVPRDVEIYQDKVTGGERVFLLLGDPGIISGVYDESLPSKIRWDDAVEFPAAGRFNVRPLGIVEANDALLFSVGGVIYRRIDGPKPRYTPVVKLGDGVNADLGGIRGLTAIPKPDGAGESVLLVWIPKGHARGQIKRLDPDGAGGYTVHDEATLWTLMSRQLGVGVRGTLGGYNDFHPVQHPATGETVHLIGFQGALTGSESLWREGTRYYAGAMYAVRAADGNYSAYEVNGRYVQGKEVLVAPRTFCMSPFGDGLLFVGGYDANFKRSDDAAWVFRAPLGVALGGERR